MASASAPIVLDLCDSDDDDNNNNSDLHKKPAARAIAPRAAAVVEILAEPEVWSDIDDDIIVLDSASVPTQERSRKRSAVENNHGDRKISARPNPQQQQQQRRKRPSTTFTEPHNRIVDLTDFTSTSTARTVPSTAPVSPVARMPQRPRKQSPTAARDACEVLTVPPSTTAAAAHTTPRTQQPRKRQRPESQSSSSSLPPQQQQQQQQQHDSVFFAGTAPPKLKPLHRVWEIFPDVRKDHAEQLLRDCKDQLDRVLSILSDGNYPKQTVETGSVAAALARPTNTSVFVKRTKIQPKYDYLSPSCFDASVTYISEAHKQLLYEFPFITINGMATIMQQAKQHYSISRHYILTQLKGKSDKKKPTIEEQVEQYQHYRYAMTTRKLHPDQVNRLGRSKVYKRQGKDREQPNISDPILREEIRYNEQELQEWIEGMQAATKRLQARKQPNTHKVECGCCFESMPLEEMVSCRSNAGHLFCTDCIQHYAETAVFSTGSLGTIQATKKPATELLCCDASGCQAGFVESQLQKALPINTWEKYNELQFRANCEVAGIEEEMCTCPKCGMKANLPASLIIFDCPMEDCRHSSCRKCGKEPHIPLRCEEVVQQARQDEGRLKVEEAMAKAKIRTCPKCQTPFVKSDGCNKMTCRCGVKICYICRQQLKGQNPYTHFCQVPHCKHENCSKCTLYSNDQEDDERAMREAGVTAAETFQQQTTLHDKHAPRVQIDVDGILRKGVTSSSKNRKTRRI